MKRVALVGCGKSKLRSPAPAKDLYTGQLFRSARAYAERFCDAWAILSAKHFVLLPNEMVEPYDLRLEDLDVDHLRQWAWHVNWRLYDRFRSLWELVRGPVERCVMEDGHVVTHQRVVGLKGVEFVFLAGEAYAQGLTGPSGRTYPATFPLRGLGVGERLRFFKEALDGPGPLQCELQEKGKPWATATSSWCGGWARTATWSPRS